MKRHILSTILLLFCVTLSALAQTPRAELAIRYVASDGKYENDGTSWATAKKNIQDAINDLYGKGLTGEVWVAQGTYSPTESTESEGGSTLYMSFKVYPGITVRGGFYGNEKLASDRVVENIDVAGETADTYYRYKTTLTGDLSQPSQFTWNNNKQMWDAAFYGNCYHVVWFATNGFDTNSRALPLDPDRGDAIVEGCVIQGGNARNTDLVDAHPHTAYGGGAYMVKGSRLENCVVQYCEASRDGGGIYMDGGGVVKHCYIANCQALGLGVRNGYGGGVCIDTNYGPQNPANEDTDRMGIYRSSIVGNVGRLGGGLAIKYEKTDVATASTTTISPEYMAFASAVVVANNTASTEGGGVYTEHGGAMTNMTIVRNCCNGTGVLIDGIVTGRSGGLYCRDHALVMNSVMWGNVCEANGDVQYAASISSSSAKSVEMKYCALSMNGSVDWSTTASSHVFGIMNYNNGTHYTTETASTPTGVQAFPNFLQPSPEAGCYDGVGDGLNRKTNWIISTNGCLANRGIASHDLNLEGKYPFVDTPSDILGLPYNSHSSLGAYCRRYLSMTAKAVGTDEYHFYVDPNANTYRTDTQHGISWLQPARYLANVLYCIKNKMVSNVATGEYATAKFVIHVKEGTVNNTDSYSHERVRNVVMHLCDGVTILGGYPADMSDDDDANKAKNLERNPVKYPTILTGDLLDNYELSVSKMLVLNNVSDVVIDGIQIRNVNARSRLMGNENTFGAALNIQGCTDVKILNTLIAGCTADEGAAVIVKNSQNVKFENCIFHNNDSRVLAVGEGNQQLSGNIVVESDNADESYKVSFSHCNIMNNVGYAIMLSNAGSINIENSMMFANTREPRSKVYYTENTAQAQQGFRPVVAAGILTLPGSTGTVTMGNGVLFDEYSTINTQTGKLRYLLNAPNEYPRFVNGVVNSGVTPAGDMTFYGRATSFMPHNENPMTNAAVHTGTHDTWGKDMSCVVSRDYGGLPDVGAIENNASAATADSENLYPGGQPAYGGVVYVRDYNTYQDALDANGDRVLVPGGEDKSIYHADGTTLRDGSSWENAINGNAMYTTGTVEVDKTFIIGARNNGSDKNIYYTKGQDTELINFVMNDEAAADRYRLEPADKQDHYYIYNVTHGKYVYYTQVAAGKNCVKLQTDKNADNSIWYIRYKIDDKTYGLSYAIIPSTVPDPYADGAQCWNYNGGVSYQSNLGLYGSKDSYSTWQIIEVDRTVTSSSEMQVNGLQYAIDNARFEDGQHPVYNFVEGMSYIEASFIRTVVTDEWLIMRNFNRGNYYIAEEGDKATSTSTITTANPIKIVSAGVVGGKEAYRLQTYSGKYLQEGTENNKKVLLTNDVAAAATYYVEVVDDKYLMFELTTNIDYRYLNNTADTGLGLGYYKNGADDRGNKWEVKRAVINGSNVEFAKLPVNRFTSGEGVQRSNPATVYVGAGTYKGSYFMRDGVSMLGGFPSEGNPGEGERNIANKELEYMTVLDGNHTFRVLSQDEYFVESTLLEGFVIRNGRSAATDMGAGVKIMKNGVVKNCRIEKNTFDVHSTSPAPCGGAGAYITSGAIIMNSIVENNYVDAHGVAKLAGGAGVFAQGGSMQNSLVVRNTTLSTGANLLGAGVFVDKKSQFYNCTIAYNFGDTGPSGHAATGGVWDADARHQDGQLNDDGTETIYDNYSTFYNCIIWGNYANGNTEENVIQVGMSGRDDGGGRCYDAMQDCYTSASHAKLASDRDTDPNRVHNFKTSKSASDASYTLFLDSCRRYQPFIGTWETTDFSLRADALECINKGGSQALLETMGITEDIVGDPRVIDCTVDKGAYEYINSYAIQPRVITKVENGATVVDHTKPATFYVTPEGHGLASAADPSNAACAAKLQRVLDAAGRYKYQNPQQQVIVKVATYENGTDFQYYATRTTDESDMDVRVWSIIVPRGVEVWGGYADKRTTNDDEEYGFYKIDGTDNRNITKNETRFDSYYKGTDNLGVTTYHVVTFTDKVFDGNGKPYKEGDALTGSSTWKEGDTYMSMGTRVTDRAVLDGIFITGGQADMKATTTTTRNINSYGGAAIVTDYAHVRNCIVRDNKGVYGGALALMHNALVTGCLIDRNQADYGGAIYVFPNGTALSNGTTVDSENGDYTSGSQDDYSKRYDYKMSHVLSTTIVNNDASVQGGGVWFKDNVRFHSVAVWQNRCDDQANVSGQYNVTRPDNQNYFTTEFYPFNYSAIQGIRPSGIDNVSLNNENKGGVRFYSVTKDQEGGSIFAKTTGNPLTVNSFDDFGFFAPSDYSLLTRGGIPLSQFETYKNRGLAAKDFMGVERDVTSGGKRRFLEIGALVSNKQTRDKQLMLRLFVAKAENVNADAALAMFQAGENAAEGSYSEYYSQEGSSFAYPFNRLQDALDYIYRMRGHVVSDDPTQRFNAANIWDGVGNNMPFEIWMGPGTYMPTDDLTGNNENTVGNTFLIPEGVSLSGGFSPDRAYPADPDDADAMAQQDENGNPILHFFGAYNQPKSKTEVDKSENTPDGQYFLASNQKKMALKDGGTVDKEKNYYEVVVTTDTEGTEGTKKIVYRLHQTHTDLAYASRKKHDVNANSVQEPWEMEMQTILSGQMEGAGNKGVHHIVTIMPNQEFQGALPREQGEKFNNPESPSDYNYGYVPHEHGQIITFDGLTFTGGYAYGYQEGTVNDEHKIKFNHGGAILVDGNQYNNRYNKPDVAPEYKHATKVGSVGYREIPVLVNRCKFENNQAGYGGAISTNTTLDALNCSFEHNRAMAGFDPKVDITVNGNVEEFSVKYPGVGGAIYSTYQLSAVNTSFENNEATDLNTDGHTHIGAYDILSDLIYAKQNGINATPRMLYAGSGGAVFMANHGQFHFMNCNFVRNQALAYPAIYTTNPNYDYQQTATDLYGYPSLKSYNQAINTVFWGNEINPIVVDAHQGGENAHHLDVIQRVVNYGVAGRGSKENGKLTVEPFDVDLAHAPTQAQLDDENQYAEQIWFSAYEAGRGKKPINDVDMREATFTPRVHVKKHLEAELARLYPGKNYAYQNCNIEIDSQNNTSEGPNFVNPSQNAGYAGYLENADWSPARLCSLTDNGWGKIEQKTTSDDNVTYETNFLKYSETNPVPTGVPADRSLYSSEAIDDYDVEGAYPTLRYMKGNEKYQKTVPIGDDVYMQGNYGEANPTKPVEQYRISKDPNPSQEMTYIDMGVYEYHHTPLQVDNSEADAVDVIWVSPREKPDNGLPDGSAWSQPTSDFQRAVETLLSSRNGHRKEIRLLDGTITPIYTIDGMLAFYIDTEKQNNSTFLDKKEGEIQDGLGVKSLTIKGGYSYELPNVRDDKLYPAIIRQQKRTDGGESKKWNHLFYIKDATQRYGDKNGTYNQENGWGHRAGNDEKYKSVYTIPIEFDGVRLINNQAAAGTQGAAIHYASLNTPDDDENSILTRAEDAGYWDESKGVSSTPANVTVGYSKGTTGNDYKHAYATVQQPAKIIISKSHIIGSGKEGDTDANASAVYLEDPYGHAILYNNVFHSNHVSPLDARCRAVTVNNTYALNGGPVKLRGAASTLHNSVMWRNKPVTIGANQYQFVMTGVNDAGTIDYANTGSYFSDNAYTGAPGESNDYTDSDTGLKQYSYNARLTDENSDVLSGPNFKKYENGDIMNLDFSFIPSLRLMNKGKNAHYNILTTDDVELNQKEQVVAIKNSEESQKTMLYDLALNTTHYEDAASNPRIVGNSIDLGAYEYQNTLRRVFYVNPLNDIMGSGATWADPIGRNGIQDAVNLAALYHANNDKEQAFVFVKGATMRDKEFHTGESITLHDGVSIYGSIDNELADTVKMKNIETDSDKMPVYRHTDQHIISYLLTLDEYDEGQVGPNTYRTAINGIYTSPNTHYNTETGVVDDSVNLGFHIHFPIYSLISGFHVTNKNAVTQPVIDIDPQVSDGGKPKVALRKIAVYNNNLAADAPVTTLASVKNALVYNSLFRDNDAKGGSVLRLEDDAWAVNISAQGKTESKVNGTYVSPYNGHGTGTPGLTTEKENRIVYSIVNYDGQDLAADNPVTLQTKLTMSGHNYRRSDRNMYFQLAEGSPHINEIAIDLVGNKTGNDFLPENLRWFVNYRRDRDMMGNPRVLTLLPTSKIPGYTEGKHLLDRGCFETWFINDELVTTSTGASDQPHHSPAPKHFAPHTGSVVYINNDCNLVCGTALQPGFLLLKSGASLYGNGQNVKVSYIAVEREIHPNGSVVSMPFPMDYSAEPDEDGMYVTGIARAYYQDAAGNVTDKMENSGVLHLDYAEGEHTGVYDYMPEERMAPDYTFAVDDSEAWRDLTTTTARGNTQKAANQGVLIVPDMDAVKAAKNSKGENLYTIDEATGTVSASSPVKLIYSFTARGEFFDSYVYEETEDETSKTVTLGQHDETESADNKAGFTSKEDMGWNCIGMPYLVSDYQTIGHAYVPSDMPASYYNMHVPHTLWLYYNGKTPADTDDESFVDGDGGFYSVPSWENTTENSWHLPTNDTPRLWFGEGIFVQTAALSKSEDLTFYRPKYVTSSSSPVRGRSTTRYYVDEDIDETVVSLDIVVRGRTIYVRGLQGGEQLAIHDIPGRCYQMATAREGRPEWSYALSHPGIYIVTVNGVGRKVVVK